MNKVLIQIEGVEIGSGGDERGFESYHLYTSGNTLEQVLKEASIEVVDQDGGTRDTRSLWDCRNSIIDAGLSFIADQWEKATGKKLTTEELWNVDFDC